MRGRSGLPRVALVRRSHALSLAGAVGAITLCATPARALVVDVGFRHAPHQWTLALQGSGLLVLDGRTVEGAAGGGIAVAALGRGWWLHDAELSVEGRLRVLAAHDPTNGFAPNVPIDLVGTIGFGLVHGRNRDWNGWPSYVREYSPFVPHVGLGATVEFAPAFGNVRAGPMTIVGFTWWAWPRVGIVVDAEARALFGGGGPLGQVGLSAGVRAGL